MGFRFSMKWLLAGMVYVALVAAALSQPGWAWADALWVVSFLAVCYAGLLAIYTVGARRARTVGFLTASLAMVAAMHFAPQSVPVGRIVEALAPAPSLPTIQPRVVYPAPAYSAPTPTAPGNSSGWVVPVPYPQGMVSTSGGVSTGGYYNPLPVLNLQTYRYRAGSALAVMLAGVAGGVLGAVAYRQGRGRSGE
jgi:hypothetical protein